MIIWDLTAGLHTQAWKQSEHSPADRTRRFCFSGPGSRTLTGVLCPGPVCSAAYAGLELETYQLRLLGAVISTLITVLSLIPGDGLTGVRGIKRPYQEPSA